MDTEVKRKAWRRIKEDAPQLAKDLNDMGKIFGIGFLYVRLPGDARFEIGNRTPRRMEWDGQIRPLSRRVNHNER